MKFKIGQKVHVVWEDSFRPSGPVWYEWKTADSERAFCESMGWVVSLGVKTVTIAGHVFDADIVKFCSGTITIPRVSIVKVTRVH